LKGQNSPSGAQILLDVVVKKGVKAPEKRNVNEANPKCQSRIKNFPGEAREPKLLQSFSQTPFSDGFRVGKFCVWPGNGE
jgi:hypothetical protein